MSNSEQMVWSILDNAWVTAAYWGEIERARKALDRRPDHLRRHFGGCAELPAPCPGGRS